MNCCVVALSSFSSDIPTWSADSLYSVQWRKIRKVRVEEYAYCVNKLRQNVGWETWIWRHTQWTPNTNNHHTPRNENPLMKIFCVYCLAWMGRFKGAVDARCWHWLATSAAFTAKVAVWPLAQESADDSPRGAQKPSINEADSFQHRVYQADLVISSSQGIAWPRRDRSVRALFILPSGS